MENTVRIMDGPKKEIVEDHLTSLSERPGKIRQQSLMMTEDQGIVDRMQRQLAMGAVLLPMLMFIRLQEMHPEKLPFREILPVGSRQLLMDTVMIGYIGKLQQLTEVRPREKTTDEHINCQYRRDNGLQDDLLFTSSFE